MKQSLTSISPYMFHRYQRVSPDILPLSHGRKPILNRAWKDETADHSSRNATHFPCEGKPVRARSVLGTADPSPTREHQLPRISFPSDSPSALAASDIQPLLSAPVSFTAFPAPSKSQSRHHEIINGVDGGGDVILQWGHNKRTRAPRAECRASGDAASAHSRQILKIPRRSTAGMAPPPSGGSYARGANLRTSVVVRDAAAPLVSRHAPISPISTPILSLLFFPQFFLFSRWFCYFPAFVVSFFFVFVLRKKFPWIFNFTCYLFSYICQDNGNRNFRLLARSFGLVSLTVLMV